MRPEKFVLMSVYWMPRVFQDSKDRLNGACGFELDRTV